MFQHSQKREYTKVKKTQNRRRGACSWYGWNTAPPGKWMLLMGDSLGGEGAAHLSSLSPHKVTLLPRIVTGTTGIVGTRTICLFSRCNIHACSPICQVWWPFILTEYLLCLELSPAIYLGSHIAVCRCIGKTIESIALCIYVAILVEISKNVKVKL